MDLDIGKVWIGAIAVAVGAIAGGWIWAQRAAGIAARAAQAAGEDALLQQVRHTGFDALAATLQGAMGGAIIGAVAVLAYFYFTNPDRGMLLRKMDVDDNY